MTVIVGFWCEMSSVCGLDCRLGKGLRNTVVALNKNLCCHVAEQQAVLAKSDISAVPYDETIMSLTLPADKQRLTSYMYIFTHAQLQGCDGIDKRTHCKYVCK